MHRSSELAWSNSGGIATRGVRLAAAVALTAVVATGCPAKKAAATSVRGSACGYFVNVGLFGGPQQLRGCGQPPGAPAMGASPSVTLPPGGSGSPITATDADGAAAQYGPATIFGGIWPADVASTPPSGPIAVSTQGAPSGTSVTSSADLTLQPTPRAVACEPNPSAPTPKPAAGQVCTAPGGFGPTPVEGEELHVSCTASAEAVAGTTTLRKATLVTATMPDGSPDPEHTEVVPDNPPVNYTRSGVITNVGDVFTAVYNEQIVNADGSLTVNGVHLYLFGPTAVGEMVKGSATCGITPSPPAPKDAQAPTCGTLVVAPIAPDNPTPKAPHTELIGVFDAGGLEAIKNVQVTNGTVDLGVPSGLPYLQLTPGQTGPLPVTAVRSVAGEAGDLPLRWSFDAVDKAGNSAHCPAA